MIALTREPIDSAAVLDSVRDVNAGAAVLFLGTVREITGEAVTASLQYDAYEAMATQAMEKLAERATEKWPLKHVAIVHRIGHLELGDIAIAAAVSSAHRLPSFEAGQWLIDTLKQDVPIWKQEQYADGRTEWVHPTQKSVPSDKPAPSLQEPAS